jgi:hypothetical protein
MAIYKQEKKAHEGPCSLKKCGHMNSHVLISLLISMREENHAMESFISSMKDANN